MIDKKIEHYIGRRVNFLSECTLRDDGDGPFIETWNETALGTPQPTKQQLDAIDENTAQATAAEFRRATKRDEVSEGVEDFDVGLKTRATLEVMRRELNVLGKRVEQLQDTLAAIRDAAAETTAQTTAFELGTRIAGAVPESFLSIVNRSLRQLLNNWKQRISSKDVDDAS